VRSWSIDAWFFLLCWMVSAVTLMMSALSLLRASQHLTSDPWAYWGEVRNFRFRQAEARLAPDGRRHFRRFASSLKLFFASLAIGMSVGLLATALQKG